MQSFAHVRRGSWDPKSLVAWAHFSTTAQTDQPRELQCREGEFGSRP
jgi:hypothetical protein